MLLINGAQLYESKQSDCWIYIWVLLDLVLDLRYKKNMFFQVASYLVPRSLRTWILSCTLGCPTSWHYRRTACEYGTAPLDVSLLRAPSSFWALPMDLVLQLCTGKSDTMALLGVMNTAAWEDNTSQGGLITTPRCLSL
jgi:hypothetical protein